MIERIDKILSIFATLIRDGFSPEEILVYAFTLAAFVIVIWLSMEVIKKSLKIILQIVKIIKIPIDALERVLISFFSGMGKLLSSLTHMGPSPHQPPPTD